MPLICLLLSGAALLVNGLALLGRFGPRDAAPLNLLVGGTQLALAAVIALTADGELAALVSASGIVLFGLTYLLVGLGALLDLDPAALGWFCGFVAAIALVYAAANLATDPLLAVLWLLWSLLWGLFFALLALGLSQLARVTGWALVLTGPLSTSVPAVLGLLGAWPAGAAPAAAAAALLGLLLGVAAIASRRLGEGSGAPEARRASAAGPTAAPEPALASV